MTDKREPNLMAALRAPFPDHQIGKLPKPKSKESPKGKCNECGGWHGLPAVHLDYVGHAAVTNRLLDVDPTWTWEPLAVDADGLPAIDKNGGLWIKLTVLGVTRLGYGDAEGKVGPSASKERIGDALRNAAMRFGVGLDLWHKGDLVLYTEEEDTDSDGDAVRENKPAKPAAKAPAQPNPETGEIQVEMATIGQIEWLKKKLVALESTAGILEKHGVKAIDKGLSASTFALIKAEVMRG